MSLVFIEQNGTFNLEVRLCLSVSTGYLPTSIIWRTLALYGVR